MSSRIVSDSWTSRRTGLDLDGLFALIGEEPFALLHGQGRWWIFAEGPLAVLTEPETSGYAFERQGAVPPIHPDFIGFLTYEWGYGLDPLMPTALPKPFPFPDFHFVLYRRLVVFDQQEGILYEGQRTGLEAPSTRHLLGSGPFSARKVWDSDTPEGYAAKVSRIREEIAAGNVYQVDLTRQEAWAYGGDLRRFARKLSSLNPAPFSAFLADQDSVVVSSSPERFVRLSEGRLLVQPIKGTAPRGRTPEEDEALKAELLTCEKNGAELAMIADLLRNDLTRACVVPSVRVDACPDLESYANVHHLVATVSGEALPGLTLRQLLEALFPGGSITGCPKLASMELIRELEAQPRMLYTGSLGWFSQDLTQLDLNIAIRTAFGDARELRFGVGGGVVWDSDPRAEYEETVHKGASLVACLTERHN